MVEIQGKLIDKLSGYALIKKDLDSALNWIKLAQKMLPEKNNNFANVKSSERDVFDQIKALFVAALTFYGKCYTEAAGRHAQVSRDWLDTEHKELHDFYMKYRHNFAAHSGDERLELAKTYVLVHPKKKEGLLPYLPTIRVQPDLVTSSDDEKNLRDLIGHVRKILLEKNEKLTDKVINSLVLTKDENFWRAAVKEKKPVVLELPHRGSKNSKK